MTLWILVLVASMLSDRSELLSLYYPRIVWMYHDSNLHPMVEKIIHTTKTTLSSRWTVHFLSPSNLTSFIDLNSLPANYHALIPSHKSACILVANHGIVQMYGFDVKFYDATT